MKELKRLVPYLRPRVPLLVASTFLLIVSGLLEALIISLLAPIFDQLAPSAAAAGGKFDFLRVWLGLEGDSYLGKVALFLVIFSLVKGVCLFVADYSLNYAGERLVATLREDLYGHILDQSLAFFSRFSTGKLMTRIITDTERLHEAVGKRLTDFIRQIFLLIFFLGLVFYADWKLALLSFAIAPVVLLITFRLGRKIRRDSLLSQENLYDLSHVLQQTVSGQKIVQAFNAQTWEKDRLRRLLERLVRSNLKVARMQALGSPLIEFIGYAAFVPFLLYFNYKLGQGFALSSFVVFVAALFRLYEPVRKLSRMHLFFQQTFASAQRVFELLDTRIEVKEVPGAPDLPPFREEIRFHRVWFAYPENPQLPVLRDIDLRIRKGEMLALVGMSGAGKSTLVSLIPRFYDPTSGSVTIDGWDLREVTLSSLRSQVALVTQETFLFDDTVRNNIAYSRFDARQEEVEEAARAAFIHDFIMSLPDGYDTVVGERGHRLSGGERQRIAIARAILKKAPILLLDEATSSLDSESELLVRSALENLMQRCTSVVIAHRLSTVRRADRIVVLHQGRIVEVGSHEMLMARSGIYRRLNELQFADVESMQPVEDYGE
ncbi:MAG TPA: ABC transporter ATP-binding protein [Acidobacteriota bacterium]|nr:ABC transporter ATP-binding protein [Acidobacteriota bacterium]